LTKTEQAAMTSEIAKTTEKLSAMAGELRNKFAKFKVG
jgi:methyl-accepting chemotaxis protein